MFSSAPGRGWTRHRTDPRPGPHEGPLQRSFEPNWPVPEEEAEGEREGESDALHSFMQFHAGQHGLQLQYGVWSVYY